MSYTMTHLIIANEYALKHNIQNKDFFLLGSISPDAVHFVPNYDKSLKEHSHFLQSDKTWGSIYKEEHMHVWYERLKEFYIERQSLPQSQIERDFLQGYCLHILTDIFNSQYVYAPNLILHGLDIEPFREEFRNQCILWDHFLYLQSQDRDSILQELLQGTDQFQNDSILEHLNLEYVIQKKCVIEQAHFYATQYQSLHKDTTYLNHIYQEVKKISVITQEKSDFFIRHVVEQADSLLFQFPYKDGLFKVTID